MITIPSAFGLSALAKPLLRILTTPDFVSGSTTVPFVAFGVVFYCFFRTFSYIFQIVNKTYINIRLLSTAAVINIVLNLLLIPLMGLVGAAIATFIAYGILGMLTLIVTRRYLKFDLSLPFIVKSIIASAIMALCIWLINPFEIYMILVTIVVGVIVYFGILILVKGLSREEITFFKNFLRENLERTRLIKRSEK